MRWTQRLSVFLGMLLVWLTSLAWGQPTYQVQDLGDFIPMAINDQGSMAGHASTLAARWLSTQAAMQTIGDPVSGATAIDPSNVIVGFAQHGPDLTCGLQAVWWDASGQIHSLGCLAPHGDQVAQAINAQAQICGAGTDARGMVRAVRWTPTPTVLTDYGDGASCQAINSLGWMLGYVIAPDGQKHAVVWTSPQAVDDLHDFLGGVASWGCCFTDPFRIAGTLVEADGTRHAWRWSLGEEPEMLPDPPGASSCGASAMNRQGDVVGDCDTGAVLWPATGEPVDLSHMAPDGLPIQGASGINDAGVITCSRFERGVEGGMAGCLLTPTPAKATH